MHISAGVCVGVHTRECWCQRRPEEDVRFPGPGVRGSCESPNVCAGNKSSGPLQEQCVLVNVQP